MEQLSEAGTDHLEELGRHEHIKNWDNPQVARIRSGEEPDEFVSESTVNYDQVAGAKVL